MLDILFRWTGIVCWSILLIILLGYIIFIVIPNYYRKLKPWHYVILYYLMPAKKLNELYTHSICNLITWRLIRNNRRKALRVQRYIIVKRVRKYRLKLEKSPTQ